MEKGKALPAKLLWISSWLSNWNLFDDAEGCDCGSNLSNCSICWGVRVVTWPSSLNWRLSASSTALLEVNFSVKGVSPLILSASKVKYFSDTFAPSFESVVEFFCPFDTRGISNIEPNFFLCMSLISTFRTLVFTFIEQSCRFSNYLKFSKTSYCNSYCNIPQTDSTKGSGCINKIWLLCWP